MLYILRPSHFQEDIKALRKSLSPRRKQEKGHKTNSATGRVRQLREKTVATRDKEENQQALHPGEGFNTAKATWANKLRDLALQFLGETRKLILFRPRGTLGKIKQVAPRERGQGKGHRARST